MCCLLWFKILIFLLSAPYVLPHFIWPEIEILKNRILQSLIIIFVQQGPQGDWLLTYREKILEIILMIVTSEQIWVGFQTLSLG